MGLADFLFDGGGLVWWAKMLMAALAGFGTFRLIKYRKKLKAARRVADRPIVVPVDDEDLVPL